MFWWEQPGQQGPPPISCHQPVAAGNSSGKCARLRITVKYIKSGRLQIGRKSNLLDQVCRLYQNKFPSCLVCEIITNTKSIADIIWLGKYVAFWIHIIKEKALNVFRVQHVHKRVFNN